MNPFALTAEERAGAMMAPARTPDVGAFMDNLGALRAMIGGRVADGGAWLADDVAGTFDGEGGAGIIRQARSYIAEESGKTYGGILPLKKDDATGDLSFALPGFARDSITGILDMLEGKMTPEASMALLDIPVGGLLHAGVTGARQTPETLAALRAYHGSPHRFDRFSMDKIGTGEGAQAFGHGLYMAGNPGVAKSYKTTGPAGRALLDEVNAKLKSVSREMSTLEIGGQYHKFRDPKRGKELVEEYERLLSERSNLGNLYTVKLDVEPDDLLDWDVPLSEQSEKVRAAIEEIRDVYRDLDGVGNALDGDIRGGQLVQLMQGILGGKDKATQEMRAAGIHGIKFLDQGSRLPVARARKPVDEWLRTIDGATAKLKKLDDEAAALPEGNPAADSMRQRLADERARVQRNMDNAREQLAIAEKYNRDLIDEAEALATRNFVMFDDSLISIESVE